MNVTWGRGRVCRSACWLLPRPQSRKHSFHILSLSSFALPRAHPQLLLQGDMGRAPRQAVDSRCKTAHLLQLGADVACLSWATAGNGWKWGVPKMVMLDMGKIWEDMSTLSGPLQGPSFHHFKFAISSENVQKGSLRIFYCHSISLASPSWSWDAQIIKAIEQRTTPMVKPQVSFRCRGWLAGILKVRGRNSKLFEALHTACFWKRLGKA